MSAERPTSTDPPGLRIGDRERTEAAERLSAHAAAGRLSVDELERRLEAAQSAVFANDLITIEADLPGPSPRRPGAPSALPLAAVACLLAAVLATVLVGHPIAPLFLVALLLWRGGRHTPRNRLRLDRSLPG